MRRLLILLCLAATAGAQEREPEDRPRATVSVDSPRATWYVGEPLRLRLRVCFDREYFRAHLVPLFGREMDLQVQLDAPFLAGLPGLTPLPVPPPASDPDLESLVLNAEVAGAVRVADQEWDGRAVTVLELARTFLPTRAGEVTLPAPKLRYALASRFTEDFINGRRPLDRREEVATGLPLTLRVVDPPEEGRPPEFTGAIGTFRIEAAAEPVELRPGEILKLTLRIEGEGNLPHFAPPRMDGLDGFHIYGSIDDRGAPVRTIVYEAAPVRENVRSVPAIPFAFLSPGPPAVYRVVRTRPIPLVVRPGGAVPPRSATAGEDHAADDDSAPGATLPILAVCLAVAVSSVLILSRRRARGRPAADAQADRLRGAAEAFESGIAGPDADVAGAFAGFLAAGLDCPAAAVIAPDLRERLVAAGLEAGLAARAAALLTRLIEARYGGDGADDGPGAARALVAELVEAFETD